MRRKELEKENRGMKLPLWLHDAYCFLFAVHLPYVPASRVQVYARDFFTSSDHYRGCCFRLEFARCPLN